MRSGWVHRVARVKHRCPTCIHFHAYSRDTREEVERKVGISARPILIMWEQEKYLRKVRNGKRLSHGGVTEYSSDNIDVVVLRTRILHNYIQRQKIWVGDGPIPCHCNELLHFSTTHYDHYKRTSYQEYCLNMTFVLSSPRSFRGI